MYNDGFELVMREAEDDTLAALQMALLEANDPASPAARAELDALCNASDGERDAFTRGYTFTHVHDHAYFNQCPDRALPLPPRSSASHEHRDDHEYTRDPRRRGARRSVRRADRAWRRHHGARFGRERSGRERARWRRWAGPAHLGAPQDPSRAHQARTLRGRADPGPSARRSPYRSATDPALTSALARASTATSGQRSGRASASARTAQRGPRREPTAHCATRRARHRGARRRVRQADARPQESS